MTYPAKKLEDYIEILSGFAFKSKDFSTDGIPVIKIKNIVPPSVTLEDLSYIPNDIAEQQSKFLLRYNDVLIALTGSHINQMASVVGRVAKVKYSIPTLLNQRVGKITVKKESECDIRYIFYYLSQDTVKIQLAKKAGGAANQANISPSDIKNLWVPLPDILTQRRIADILSEYDDLIENNQKQIKLLEEAAQRLYKEWFVNLRFPGHETTSIVGGIPKGWFMTTVEDIGCQIESGSRPKGGIDSSLRDGIPSIGAENVIGLGKYNFSADKLVSLEFYNSMKRGKLKDRDILIYKDGAYIGRTSLFQDGFPHEKAAVNEHVFLLHTENKSLQYFLFFTLYQYDYFVKMQKLNKNAAQPGINAQAMLSLDLLLPPSHVVHAFDEFISPIMKNIFAKAKLNRELAEARNHLLPKLMSGEIEV